MLLLILCKDICTLLHVISLVDWPKHAKFFFFFAAAAFLGKLSLFLQGADNITGQITQVVVIQFV